MKALILAVAAAILLAILLFGFLHYLGLFLLLATILGLIGIVVIVFLVVIMAIATFFAMIYYLAAKKPKVEPGEFKLEDIKDE
jgi:hypothetical protein